MSGDGELPLVRRTGKSESAFRTISEVAEELDVPQHVLRFWESKFPQVKPLKRGGGRRYYRPEDVALLRRIRDLLYSEGYTIKGVQKLLREGGHKDASTASSVTAKPDDDEELLLVAEDDEQLDFPEINDGEDDDDQPELDALVAQVAPPPVPEPAPEPIPATPSAPAVPPPPFSTETREELQALLAELEHLQRILRHH